MSVTYAQVAPHLKEYYHDNNLELWATVGNPKISPLIARLQVKNMVENAAGKGYVIPVSTARGSAASVTFSVSQGISSGSAVGNSVIRKAWTVLPKTYNLTAKWDREAILAASNPDALFDVMKDEINARIEKGRLRAAIALLEDGYGRVATITSAPTSTYITVKSSLLNRFEIGDSIQAGATLTGALRAGTALISGIDEDANRLYINDMTGNSWASGDVIFFAGDHTDSVVTMMTGLKSYLPDAAPTTDLNGVVRTNDPTVSGRRIDCSNYDIITALMKAAKRLHSARFVAKDVYVSIDDFENLSLDKDRVKILDMEVGEYKIGFATALLNTPVGPIKIQTEAMMEQGRFYMGDFDNKDTAPFLVTTGDLIRCDDFSGNELKDMATETAYEQRWFMRSAFAMPNPGAFIVGHSVPA